MVTTELDKIRRDESAWLTAAYFYSKLVDSSVKDLDEIREKYYADAPNRFFVDSKFLLCGIPLSYLKVFRSAIKGKAVIYDPIVSQFDDTTSTGGPSEYLRELVLDKYIANFSTKVMKHGLSMYFYGPNSRGKTFNALYVAFAINFHSASSEDKALRHPFYYIKYSELMHIYSKMIFRPDESPSLQKFISKLISVDLLIIDEVGKEIKTNSASITHFESIIKERSAKDLPTIMVGNLRPKPPVQPSEGNSRRGGLLDQLNGTSMVIEDSNSIRTIYGESIYAAMMKQYKFFEFTSENNDMRKEDNEKIWKL